jgi:hypothetical protein
LKAQVLYYCSLFFFLFSAAPTGYVQCLLVEDTCISSSCAESAAGKAHKRDTFVWLTSRCFSTASCQHYTHHTLGKGSDSAPHRTLLLKQRRGRSTEKAPPVLFARHCFNKCSC